MHNHDTYAFYSPLLGIVTLALVIFKGTYIFQQFYQKIIILLDDECSELKTKCMDLVIDDRITACNSRKKYNRFMHACAMNGYIRSGFISGIWFMKGKQTLYYYKNRIWKNSRMWFTGNMMCFTSWLFWYFSRQMQQEQEDVESLITRTYKWLQLEQGTDQNTRSLQVIFLHPGSISNNFIEFICLFSA